MQTEALMPWDQSTERMLQLVAVRWQGGRLWSTRQSIPSVEDTTLFLEPIAATSNAVLNPFILEGLSLTCCQLTEPRTILRKSIEETGHMTTAYPSSPTNEAYCRVVATN